MFYSYGDPQGQGREQTSDLPLIHSSSFVDEPCDIGARTQVLHFSHVMAHSIIGSDCFIGQHVTIGSGVLIGNHVRVMNNALLISGVVLEERVYCGPSTIFAHLSRMRAKHQPMSKVSPTLVRQGANIGANSTIAAGFRVGQYAFIEAGSVIDRNVPDFAYVVGNPLRFKGWRCRCSTPLVFKQAMAVCQHCGEAYEKLGKYKIQPLRPMARPELSHG